MPRVEVPPTLHGCMPLRGDFDIEWDNDAELLLADMEFHEVCVRVCAWVPVRLKMCVG